MGRPFSGPQIEMILQKAEECERFHSTAPRFFRFCD